MQGKCGIDIIEVARIQKSIEGHPEFVNRVFSQKEIEYCESKNNMKYQHYAARFAGKEAVFKAMSELLENKYDLEWKNIEILNDKNGKPQVNFVGIEINPDMQIDVSLSHLKDYAVANCVIIK